MKRILTLTAIFAVSLGYGCTRAHAQCPGGQCPAVQQATYQTPVRQVIHGAAQAFTQATAPKCGAREHKGLLERIHERREARKAQRQGGGCCSR